MDIVAYSVSLPPMSSRRSVKNIACRTTRGQ